MASRSVLSSVGVALPRVSGDGGSSGGSRRTFSVALSRLVGGVKRKSDAACANSATARLVRSKKRSKYSLMASFSSTTPAAAGAPLHGTSRRCLSAATSNTAGADTPYHSPQGTTFRDKQDQSWSLEIFMASMLAVGTALSFAAGAQQAFEPDSINLSSDGDVSDGLKEFDWQERIPLGDQGVRVGPPRFPEVYNASASALQGRRSSMEDNLCVGDGGRFVAIFDGHRGPNVSTLLRDHLYDSYVAHLLEQRTSNVWAPTAASRVNALRAAFEEVGKEALEDAALHYEGSTACAVVLHEEENGKRTLVSANVGDSRALLSRNGEAIALTRDHKPDDELERKRIESMGGELEYDKAGLIYRVNNLAISRSIGDRYAKPVVSCEPELKEVPLAEEGDEFILVASDGLWDVMTNQEAVNYVRRKLRSAIGESLEEKRKSLSNMLSREAIRRGSVDNVGVAIVWLS